jgi:hypothetical protein
LSSSAGDEQWALLRDQARAVAMMVDARQADITLTAGDAGQVLAMHALRSLAGAMRQQQQQGAREGVQQQQRQQYGSGVGVQQQQQHHMWRAVRKILAELLPEQVRTQQY